MSNVSENSDPAILSVGTYYFHWFHREMEGKISTLKFGKKMLIGNFLNVEISQTAGRSIKTLYF